MWNAPLRTPALVGAGLAMLALTACPPSLAPQTVSTRWTLTFETAEGQAELPALTFDDARGLGSTRLSEPSDYPKGAALSFSSLTLTGGGDCDDGDSCLALSEWEAAIVAAGEACPSDGDPAVCAADWENARLTRSALLQWHEEEGTVLAEWSLRDVFPTSVIMEGDEGSGVISLSVEANVEAFAFADNDTIRDRFGAIPLVAEVPAAPEDPTDDAQMAAFVASMESFSRRYRCPDEVAPDLDVNALRSSKGGDEDSDGDGLPLALGDLDKATPLLYQGLRQSSYTVELDGVPMARADDVGGLSPEVETVEYQDGDDLLLRKRPGRVKYADVTLERAVLTGDGALWDWYLEGLVGDVTTKDLTVRFSSSSGAEATWALTAAAPSSLERCRGSSSSIDAGLAIEKIELAVEKVERAQ